LLEHTVLIAEAITHGRNFHRSHRIEEAGRQTPKAAVAQTHIDFLLTDRFEVDAQLFQRRHSNVEVSGVVEHVFHQPAHQILERKIIETAHVLLVVHPLRNNQPGKNLLANRHGRRNPPIPRLRSVMISRERVGQVAQDRLLKLCRIRSADSQGCLGHCLIRNQRFE